MKFTINKDLFLKELSKMQGVSEKRQAMLILSNILITAEENKITLLSTNMEVGIITTFEANVLEKGKTTASSKGLFDIIKELEPGLIEINTSDNVLLIKASKAEFKIPTLPASDFPKIPFPSKKPGVELDSNKFIHMLDRVSFCASSDETKYNLNSVYIDKSEKENNIRIVSTDGHRLAIVDDELLNFSDVSKGSGILIPKKGALEIRKIIDEVEKFSILFESEYIYIFAGHTILFVKEMDLKYPDYLRVIPNGNEKSFKITKKDLLSSLRRVSLVSTVKSKTVLLSLAKDSLVLSSKSPDFGEATEELLVNYNKDNVDIRFNARYLLDILSVTPENEITFEIGDPLSPILVKPQNEALECKYVVMPMRL